MLSNQNEVSELCPINVTLNRTEENPTFMKKYKVSCITSGSTLPPEPDKIEREIETMTNQGWHLARITTGGGGSGSGNVTSWVYILFEREL